jgi:hypothetical protein
MITGLLMLAVALTLYLTKQPADSKLQYIAYILYALGITWTLIGYRRSPAYTGKFQDLFGQGFRCFIVVAIIMVSFTGIFSKMHPEFARESAQAYKEYLLKEKTKTPAEIEAEAETYREQYTIRLVSASIFGYLVMGAVITAAASLILTRRNP